MFNELCFVFQFEVPHINIHHGQPETAMHSVVSIGLYRIFQKHGTQFVHVSFLEVNRCKIKKAFKLCKKAFGDLNILSNIVLIDVGGLGINYNRGTQKLFSYAGLFNVSTIYRYNSISLGIYSFPHFF